MSRTPDKATPRPPRDWGASRRELLQGLGLGLGCLPLLQATRSYAASPEQPRRFVCVVAPNGYRMSSWLPAGGPGPLGAGPLPSSTAALEPHRDALIFLPGLTKPGYTGCEACGHGAYGTLFTGGPPSGGDGDFKEPASASVDQIIAAGLGGRTSVASLALQVLVDVKPTVPRGGRRCFWHAKGAPVEPQADPVAVAAQLFTGKPAGAVREWAQRKSVLDWVGSELSRFGRRLGREDRPLIDAHMDAIRGVERELAQMPAASGPTCGGPDLGPKVDPAVPSNFVALVGVQLKLLVAALRCGFTQVVTLQLGDAMGSGISFPFAGVGGGDWDALAHTPAAGGADAKAVVDAWCMSQLAQLLSAMKTTPDGGGTLLDSAAVLWATNMEDGATHDAQKLPWLLAGSCGGYFKTGQLAQSAGKPLNGVLAEIASAMGVPVPYVGDPAFTQSIPGLKV